MRFCGGDSDRSFGAVAALGGHIVISWILDGDIPRTRTLVVSLPRPAVDSTLVTSCIRLSTFSVPFIVYSPHAFRPGLYPQLHEDFLSACCTMLPRMVCI